ncbi:aminodeoxychorismate synthase component I [Corynebacterium sp. zg254]|uniref:Aminodeoxychorismate synthase component I n=1 Tax=Corynebacterium zhongnanshanii TaxID=2768834 RepID=A0ABQ6VBR9_9CORY|nr:MULTISPECIES: aminodeoxychorismate synthase component I [Corynebacterium]KAB3519196.1 aminodeoxychorismate synthase component I [Corynebacterium zhongnanshanii]MCR5915048.1 aminodeoxychorismate synthase component I [Corynebacterium sp. zg254]
MTVPLRLVFRRVDSVDGVDGLTGTSAGATDPRAATGVSTPPRTPDGSAILQALFPEGLSRQPGHAAVWLDSSLATAGSVSIIAGTGGPLSSLFCAEASDSPLTDNIFDRVRAGLRPMRIPEQWPHPFALGWLGAWGYEARHHALGQPASPGARTSDLPDVALLFADRAVVLDAEGALVAVLVDDAQPSITQRQTMWLDWAVQRLRELSLDQRDTPVPAPSSPGASFVFDQSHEEYLRSIQACQNFIAAGDSYEVCLTNTATGPALREIFAGQEHPELAAFVRLRAISPVPYGAFLSFPGFSVLSASPERFLRVTPDGQVSAKPIKGTRPRATSEDEDRAVMAELARSVKDRAENLMIVDLLRNDLGRVCQPGTVQVPKIFDVETYSHVHQLVSTIEGRLRAGLGAVDVLASSFPGGSMTGAPKIRTMEIIDQLERRARGFYSGAIGWLSPNGAGDLSITIRTVVDDGVASTFGVGGAIVTDSDPEAEYQETLTKASALLEALGARIEEL